MAFFWFQVFWSKTISPTAIWPTKYLIDRANLWSTVSWSNGWQVFFQFCVDQMSVGQMTSNLSFPLTIFPRARAGNTNWGKGKVQLTSSLK